MANPFDSGSIRQYGIATGIAEGADKFVNNYLRFSQEGRAQGEYNLNQQIKAMQMKKAALDYDYQLNGTPVDVDQARALERIMRNPNIPQATKEDTIQPLYDKHIKETWNNITTPDQLKYFEDNMDWGRGPELANAPAPVPASQTLSGIGYPDSNKAQPPPAQPVAPAAAPVSGITRVFPSTMELAKAGVNAQATADWHLGLLDQRRTAAELRYKAAHESTDARVRIAATRLQATNDPVEKMYAKEIIDKEAAIGALSKGHDMMGNPIDPSMVTGQIQQLTNDKESILQHYNQYRASLGKKSTTGSGPHVEKVNAPVKKIHVVDKHGNEGLIPESQLEDAKTQGYSEVGGQ